MVDRKVVDSHDVVGSELVLNNLARRRVVHLLVIGVVFDDYDRVTRVHRLPVEGNRNTVDGIGNGSNRHVHAGRDDFSRVDRGGKRRCQQDRHDQADKPKHGFPRIAGCGARGSGTSKSHLEVSF